MTRAATAPLLALAFFTLAAHADVLEFNSGDRLTGKVVTLANGQLVFNSDDAGKVTIDLARLKTFTSDDPIEIHLADGTIIKSTIAPADTGKVTLRKTNILPQQTVALTDLAAINPPAKPPVAWKGNVAAGWTATAGNTSTTSSPANVTTTPATKKPPRKASPSQASTTTS